MIAGSGGRATSTSPLEWGVRTVCLAAAVGSLAAAIWSGLARMGWAIGPQPPAWLVQGHGPIMMNGFFGTVISLERAVALGRPVGYAPPLLVAAGTFAAATLAPSIGPWPVAAGSAGVAGMFAWYMLRQPAPHHAVMGLGAVAWTVSNVLWAFDWPIFRLVPFWSVFLVWTIAGERLELARVLGPDRRRMRVLVALLAVGGLGLGLDLAAMPIGARLLGASFLGVAGWLAVCDVARRTAREAGMTGYIGRVLLSGYAWLGVGGALLMIFGNPMAGPIYDAVWHATLVGFVLTMIFAHAPVVLPALTPRRIRYRAILHLPALVLHVSLAGRLAGDLAGWPGWRLAGGIGNAAAILLFGAIVIASLE